jgi:hypothetical protein
MKPLIPKKYFVAAVYPGPHRGCQPEPQYSCHLAQPTAMMSHNFCKSLLQSILLVDAHTALQIPGLAAIEIDLAEQTGLTLVRYR